LRPLSIALLLHAREGVLVVNRLPNADHKAFGFKSAVISTGLEVFKLRGALVDLPTRTQTATATCIHLGE
jgi:hypothetical protein